MNIINVNMARKKIIGFQLKYYDDDDLITCVFKNVSIKLAI